MMQLRKGWKSLRRRGTRCKCTARNGRKPKWGRTIISSYHTKTYIVVLFIRHIPKLLLPQVSFIHFAKCPIGCGPMPNKQLQWTKMQRGGVMEVPCYWNAYPWQEKAACILLLPRSLHGGVQPRKMGGRVCQQLRGGPTLYYITPVQNQHATTTGHAVQLVRYL